MSTVVPPYGTAITPTAASSQNPQHHLNLQSHTQNFRSEINYTAEPTTPPRTPRREGQFHPTSQNKPNSITAENGSKQRVRNKNRPKSVTSSPAMTGNDRSTPPLKAGQSVGVSTSAKPISTPSTTAYAGPTFHASPAPSALPIPSFYSKLVPDSPDAKGLKILKEASLLHHNGSPPLPSPVAPIISNQVHREKSPLDFFFKADREEKARARSASSAHSNVTASNPFHPPPVSPRNSQTPPGGASQNCIHLETVGRISPSTIFAMELDGPANSSTPYGPAFSTPYAERINAARSSNKVARPALSSLEPQESIDRSEALKAYLFSDQSLPLKPAPSANALNANDFASPPSPNSSKENENGSSHLSGSRSAGMRPRPQHNSYPYKSELEALSKTPGTSGRSSGLRQEVTPTRTPTRTPNGHKQHENSPKPSRTFQNTSSSDSNYFIANLNQQSASPSVRSSDVVSSRAGNADLQGMEDSLRKILKLDSNTRSSITESGTRVVPVPPMSVPNCAGSNHQPVKGIHNGVTGS